MRAKKLDAKVRPPGPSFIPEINAMGMHKYNTLSLLPRTTSRVCESNVGGVA